MVPCWGAGKTVSIVALSPATTARRNPHHCSTLWVGLTLCRLEGRPLKETLHEKLDPAVAAHFAWLATGDLGRGQGVQFRARYGGGQQVLLRLSRGRGRDAYSGCAADSGRPGGGCRLCPALGISARSEEHTSELQSQSNLFFYLLFFFKDPAPAEIYSLSLHDALPIYAYSGCAADSGRPGGGCRLCPALGISA